MLFIVPNRRYLVTFVHIAAASRCEANRSARHKLCVQTISFDVPTRGIAVVIVFARTIGVHCDDVVSIFIDVIGEFILLLLTRSSVVESWGNDIIIMACKLEKIM